MIKLVSKKIFKTFLILVLLLVGLEVTSMLIVYLHYGYLKNTKEILNADNLNYYINSIEKNNKCSYRDQLFPHPYLGWVSWNNPKCELKKFYNKDGFVGPEFPEKYQKEYFNILITGGSVSSQFGPGIICDDKKNNFCRDYLGEKLKKFRSLSGKKIKIYNAGAGAYKHPHQGIISLLYGHLFDLVISIEGFNEHYLFYSDNINKFSVPANNFSVKTNNFFNNNFLNRFLVKTTLNIKSFGIKNEILQKSYFFSISYYVLRKSAISLTTQGDERKNHQNLFKYNLNDNLNYIELNLKKLEHLWLSFININKANSAKSLIIIHPVPFIDKQLTKNEIILTKHKDYTKIFLMMAAKANEMQEKGHWIYSFLSLFDNVKEDIYTDHSHMNSLGNELMAEKIKNILIQKNIIINTTR